MTRRSSTYLPVWAAPCRAASATTPSSESASTARMTSPGNRSTDTPTNRCSVRFSPCLWQTNSNEERFSFPDLTPATMWDSRYNAALVSYSRPQHIQQGSEADNLLTKLYQRFEAILQKTEENILNPEKIEKRSKSNVASPRTVPQSLDSTESIIERLTADADAQSEPVRRPPPDRVCSAPHPRVNSSLRDYNPPTPPPHLPIPDNDSSIVQGNLVLLAETMEETRMRNRSAQVGISRRVTTTPPEVLAQRLRVWAEMSSDSPVRRSKTADFGLQPMGLVIPATRGGSGVIRATKRTPLHRTSAAAGDSFAGGKSDEGKEFMNITAQQELKDKQIERTFPRRVIAAHSHFKTVPLSAKSNHVINKEDGQHMTGLTIEIRGDYPNPPTPSADVSPKAPTVHLRSNLTHRANSKVAHSPRTVTSNPSTVSKIKIPTNTKRPGGLETPESQLDTADTPQPERILSANSMNVRIPSPVAERNRPQNECETHREARQMAPRPASLSPMSKLLLAMDNIDDEDDEDDEDEGEVDIGKDRPASGGDPALSAAESARSSVMLQSRESNRTISAGDNESSYKDSEDEVEHADEFNSPSGVPDEDESRSRLSSILKQEGRAGSGRKVLFDADVKTWRIDDEGELSSRSKEKRENEEIEQSED